MFSEFSANLRSYRLDAVRRYELVCQRADEIGGHPLDVPQGWDSFRWVHELQRRYANMAEWEGWEALPGFICKPFEVLFPEA
jgi:hypothetical protein